MSPVGDFSLAGVSASCFLRCSDAVGRMTGRASGL